MLMAGLQSDKKEAEMDVFKKWNHLAMIENYGPSLHLKQLRPAQIQRWITVQNTYILSVIYLVQMFQMWCWVFMWVCYVCLLQQICTCPGCAGGQRTSGALSAILCLVLLTQVFSLGLERGPPAILLSLSPVLPQCWSYGHVPDCAWLFS